MLLTRSALLEDPFSQDALTNRSTVIIERLIVRIGLDGDGREDLIEGEAEQIGAHDSYPGSSVEAVCSIRMASCRS